MTDRDSGHAAKVVAALLAVYVIWGSTYLAIRFAIETLPPFLMAGTRFVVAGLFLYVLMRMRSEARPTLVEWRSAAIVGTLLLMGGNGAVVWAEQHVASGAVALLVATVPLWMVLLAWAWKGGTRPGWRVAAGILLGLVGISVLIGPDALGAGKVDTTGAIVVLIGALSWALGSIYSRSAPLPKSPFLSTAMEMLAGGVVLVVAGVATGEVASTNFGSVSTASAVAFAYLIVFGSLVGFTAYIWLLKATTPAKAATYAYVNPVVAVLLGWMLAGETLTLRTAISALIVLAAVVLITARTSKAAPPDVSKPAQNRPQPRTPAGIGAPRTNEC